MSCRDSTTPRGRSCKESTERCVGRRSRADRLSPGIPCKDRRRKWPGRSLREPCGKPCDKRFGEHRSTFASRTGCTLARRARRPGCKPVRTLSRNPFRGTSSTASNDRGIHMHCPASARRAARPRRTQPAGRELSSDTSCFDSTLRGRTVSIIRPTSRRAVKHRNRHESHRSSVPPKKLPLSASTDCTDFLVHADFGEFHRGSRLRVSKNRLQTKMGRAKNRKTLPETPIL